MVAFTHPWDLHANNVRVRKQDSIVIDFAHATTGPMSADLASLEVSLAFEWVLISKFNTAEWQQRIESMYQPVNIMRVTADDVETKDEHWLLPCLKKIRELALMSTLSPGEYGRVLAVYLLRQATFPADRRCVEEDEFRRAYAYWLANRLVVALSQVADEEREVA